MNSTYLINNLPFEKIDFYIQTNENNKSALVKCNLWHEPLIGRWSERGPTGILNQHLYLKFDDQWMYANAYHGVAEEFWFMIRDKILDTLVNLSDDQPLFTKKEIRAIEPTLEVVSNIASMRDFRIDNEYYVAVSAENFFTTLFGKVF
ncbi:MULTISPECIES: hypothetical protein [Cyanophyceae]|uniref:hypothetical protein n=1 Tax=Cyanophyceae TaxID=3028117 RepID=UPI000A0EEE92|nr:MULTISPECIES: hypothetical protein [Cyanophyceae]SMH58041.1 hypothetical protein SAMN06272755_3123 [Picosynechococcus sp. OG1]SMQ86505.1 hypothetical protein SAMN06272774_3255 [Synechococcus sp. 7002]